MILYIIIAVLVIVMLCSVYLLYKANFGTTSGKRIWPVPNPEIPEKKEVILFTADAVMDSNNLFMTKSTHDDFKTIFESDEEKEMLKKEAIEYFKKQYGMSDTFLNVAMLELRVNDKGGYNASCMKSNPGFASPVVDGGYIVFVPAGKMLHGRYGGNSGVSVNKPTTLAYGFYKMGGSYVIKYMSPCPLQVFTTYDGNYSPIDCDVEIIKSKDPKTVGLKGKAQGVYRNFKLSNGLNQVTIRNVLVF